VSEDAPVADDGDDERQQHADDDEEDGVVVGYRAVPQTLLSLGVEPVRRPAKVVRWVECDSGQPRRADSDDGVTPSKHLVVVVVPADVQVTIDTDECDCEERHDAADDTETCCSCTQPLSPAQHPLLSQYCTFNNTNWTRCASICDYA